MPFKTMPVAKLDRAFGRRSARGVGLRGGLAVLLAVGIGVFAGGSVVGTAVAQQTELPGSVDPSQIRPPEPPEPEIPSFGFSIELLIPDSRREIAPEEAESVRFTLEDLVVEGNTVFSDAELRTLYGDMVGNEVSLADLFNVANMIETQYRSEDFILSRAFVPAQRVSDGVFAIQVVEGFVNQVTLEGDSTDVNTLIESYLGKIRDDRPVRSSTLERYLLLANDIPGVQASATLRPSATERGAAHLVVNVSIDNWDGFSSVDNRGSKFAGPWANTTGFGTNALTSQGERASFLWFMTRDWAETRLGSLAYDHQVGTHGQAGLRTAD